MTNALATPSRLQIGSVSYTSQQLDLIWRTAAKDCNQDEFSQFVHVCGHLRLDPMRKQIYAFVFSKDDRDKRRMSIIVGIDGYRTVARRTGDYRPDDKPPRFVIDPERIDKATNPTGLVSCEVTVYLFAHGSWFPVPHVVEWDAYAPLVEVWEPNETGKRVPTGRYELDRKKTRWLTDPKGMLAKCAEAGAIRKAFPDDFAGVYEQAEIDKSHTIDLTAADYAETAAVERRLEVIGGKDSILFDFCDDRGLHPVPLMKLHGECDAFLRKYADDPEAVETWLERNHHQLKEFWARAKTDALDIKARSEAILKTPRREAAAQ